MAFWKWRSSSRRDEGVAPAPPREEASPLVLFTRDGRVTGLMSTAGQRMTDYLNQSETITIRQASVEPIASAALAGVSTSGGGPNGFGAGPAGDAHGDPYPSGSDVTLSPDDVLVVIPPSHRSTRQMQVHRRLRRVELQIGHILVEGHAHVTPGVPIDAWVARLTNQFVPLTNVLLEGPGTEELEQPVDAAIVNARAVVALEALS